MPDPATADPLRMTPFERRATASLAGVFALRMLGLFIVLPVLALYAEELPGGKDPALAGIALGAYALSQAILQLPFGWASDRYGRKPPIVAGLAIFAAGSFVAAWAPDIGWLIAGRTLQGAGAVSAAVVALAADLTRESVRTKAMAAIGMTIGAAFAISLVAGPVLAGVIGVPGLFVLTGALAIGAVVVVRRAVPEPSIHAAPPVDGEPRGHVLFDPQLFRLNVGIFALHAILMAMFVQVPFALRDGGLEPARHWIVYLPVLLASVVVVLPLLRNADRRGRGRIVLSASIVALAASLAILLTAGHSVSGIAAGLLVFFAAFNLLEASLPALVSRFAPPAARGTALGVFSTAQFLGTFAGAAAGGFLLKYHGPAAVYGLGIGCAAVWLVAGATMAEPPATQSSLSMGRT